jgi:hypothetical protein
MSEYISMGGEAVAREEERRDGSNTMDDGEANEEGSDSDDLDVLAKMLQSYSGQSHPSDKTAMELNEEGSHDGFPLAGGSDVDDDESDDECGGGDDIGGSDDSDNSENIAETEDQAKQEGTEGVNLYCFKPGEVEGWGSSYLNTRVGNNTGIQGYHTNEPD